MKVNFCLMALMPSLVVSVAIRDSYLKALENTKRISPSSGPDNFFLSGLYNKNGKAHDLGSNFGLTSDVYTKPNPFYTKDKSVGEKHEPVYYPVYNQIVAQDSAGPEDTFDNATPSAYDSKNNYPQSSYGAPSNTYGSATYSVQSVPSTTYGLGVQSSNYGSAGTSSYYSQPSYGQSHSSYGAPSGQPYPSYGAPTYYPSTQVTHELPEAQKSHSEWFLAKLVKKFDLILMSKILLKLIIFKKIVKFIGIICLLLFIPVLKKKFEEHTEDSDEDEERRIKELDAYAHIDFQLKEIVNFAFTSIEGFSTDNIPWCVGKSPFYCRLQYMLDAVDLRYPGSRILYLWFPKLETTTTTTAAPETTSSERTIDEGSVDFNDYITESLEADLSENEDSSENRIEKFNSVFRTK